MNLILIINTQLHNGEEVDDLLEYFHRIFKNVNVDTEIYNFPTSSALNTIKTVDSERDKIVCVASDKPSKIKMMQSGDIICKVVALGKTKDYYDYIIKKKEFEPEFLIEKALEISNHLILNYFG